MFADWDEDDGTEFCTAIEDLKDAQQVANALGINLHQVNFVPNTGMMCLNIFSLRSMQAGHLTPISYAT